MMTPPPTPNIDALIREAQDYLGWWVIEREWHMAIFVVASLALYVAFFGGLRAFFMKTPPKTPTKT